MARVHILKQVFVGIVILAVLLGIGTLYYHNTEGWSYLDALYFSTMALTTIGFGDFAPTSNETKLFTIAYALIGIGIVVYISSSIITEYLLKQGKSIRKVLTAVRKVNRYEKKKIANQAKKRKARWKKR